MVYNTTSLNMLYSFFYRMYIRIFRIESLRNLTEIHPRVFDGTLATGGEKCAVKNAYSRRGKRGNNNNSIRV